MIFLEGLDQALGGLASVIANRFRWTPVGRACSMRLTEGSGADTSKIINGRIERILTKEGRISGSTALTVKLNAPWGPEFLGSEPISELLLVPRFGGHGAARLLFSDSLVNGYRVGPEATSPSPDELLAIFRLHLE